MAAAVTQSFSPAMYTQFSNSFGIPHQPTQTTYAHSVYAHGYPHLPAAAPPVIPHYATQLSNTTGQGLVSPVSAEVNSLAYSKKTTPPPLPSLHSVTYLIYFLSSRTIIIKAHKSPQHLLTTDLAVSPHQPRQPSLPYPPPAPHPCLLGGT